MRYLLVTLVSLFVLQGCDATESDPDNNDGHIRVGTILTFEVYDLVSTHRDTSELIVAEQGTTYEGKSNVMNIHTPQSWSSTGSFFNYESNGNISELLYEDAPDSIEKKWVEYPVATLQDYDIHFDSLRFDDQLRVMRVKASYDGRSTHRVGDTAYTTEIVTMQYFASYYNLNGELTDSQSVRFVYYYSPVLKYFTGIDRYFNESSGEPWSSRERLIKIVR